MDFRQHTYNKPEHSCISNNSPQLKELLGEQMKNQQSLFSQKQYCTSDKSERSE